MEIPNMGLGCTKNAESAKIIFFITTLRPDMNPRQRILNTINLQEPDRVPIIDLIFNPDIYEVMLGRRPEYFNPLDNVNCCARMGLDAASAIYDGYPGIEPEGNLGGGWESEWGCTYRNDEGAWGVGMPFAYRVNTLNALKHFNPPDPYKIGRMDPIKKAVDLCAKYDLALRASIRGPFAFVAYHFLGMVPTLLSIYDDQGFLLNAFRMVTDFNNEICYQMAECGVDIIWITEDIAGKNGPLLNPLHYRELVLPYLREVINHIRSLGKPAVFHSDGNISQFLDDLVNIGISGLNPIERNSGMDLADLKRKFGHKICLFGNVDNKKILSDGTLEEIEEDVMNCIRAAGKGGGFVLMSDNSWHLGVSPKNAQAMVGAGRKWGRYPLDWIEKSNQGR